MASLVLKQKKPLVTSVIFLEKQNHAFSTDHECLRHQESILAVLPPACCVNAGRAGQISYDLIILRYALRPADGHRHGGLPQAAALAVPAAAKCMSLLQ